MARTTVDIDASVMRALKRRARAQGKSLGQLISELVAVSLADEKDVPRPSFEWVAKPMGARLDLEDKEALAAILDER